MMGYDPESDILRFHFEDGPADSMKEVKSQLLLPLLALVRYLHRKVHH